MLNTFVEKTDDNNTTADLDMEDEAATVVEPADICKIIKIKSATMFADFYCLVPKI